MKQKLAALLVAVFGVLSIAPALLAFDDQPNLPACCRRAGLHRCSMAHPDAGPTVQSAACPLFPASHSTAALDRASDAPVPVVAIATELTSFAALVEPQSVIRLSFSQSRDERGPPTALPLA